MFTVTLQVELWPSWSSDRTLDGITVPGENVIVSRPQHDSSILGGPLDGRQHFWCKRSWWDETTIGGSLWSCRQSQEDLGGMDWRSPLIPGCFKIASIGRVVATSIVVKLNPDVVKESRAEGSTEQWVWIGTLWSCCQVHLPLSASSREVPGNSGWVVHCE